MNKNNTKAYIIIGIAITIILTILFSIPFIKFIGDAEKLRNYIDSFGIFAPLAYVLLTMIQTFIPFIPGEPFELMAGYIFNMIEGTIFCLLAQSVASIIIIILVRKYGSKLFLIFFNSQDKNKLKKLKSKKSFIMFSILFILPGTPKDLLCYFAGLTDYDLIPLLIVTSIGRIPAIITSTITGGAFGDEKYLFAAIIYGITFLISLISLKVYDRLTQNDIQ